MDHTGDVVLKEIVFACVKAPPTVGAVQCSTFHDARAESSAMYSDVVFSKTKVHGDRVVDVGPSFVLTVVVACASGAVPDADTMLKTVFHPVVDSWRSSVPYSTPLEKSIVRAP